MRETPSQKICRILELIRREDSALAQEARITYVRQLVREQNACLAAFKTSDGELREFERRAAARAADLYGGLLAQGTPFERVVRENRAYFLKKARG